MSDLFEYHIVPHPPQVLPVYSAAVVAVTAKWFCINFGTNVANPDVRIPSEAPANIVKRKGWFRIRAQITLGNSLMGSRVAVTALDCFWLPLCICETRVSRIVLAAEKVIIEPPRGKTNNVVSEQV